MSMGGVWCFDRLVSENDEGLYRHRHRHRVCSRHGRPCRRRRRFRRDADASASACASGSAAVTGNRPSATAMVLTAVLWYRCVAAATQPNVRRYTYMSSRAIYESMRSLSEDFPNLATLRNAQEVFGLSAAGTVDDCPFDARYRASSSSSSFVTQETNDDTNMEGCLNWYLTIEDRVAHPPGSESWKHLPEVMLSGALHGNERVGPTTVVETAALLLDAAHCEALPRMSLKQSTKNHHDGDGGDGGEGKNQWTSRWEEELRSARDCRLQLEARGVSPARRRWLARLVTSRRIVVVPTANALGYFRKDRSENGIDPNRDFPYDLKDNGRCMLTIAGRTINELCRTHMFRLSLTFHAGMSAIGYEWGAPSFGTKRSPDDVAQTEIAAGYSRYAGALASSVENPPSYPYGTMNELVYPVRGGMEDWAYAGSWDDLERVPKCHPDTYGGYPESKTTYNDANLRMFNMLVETSKAKEPDRNDLGSDEDLFRPASVGRGHVSRNLRLSLIAVDLAEPYVHFVAVGHKYLQDDLVPLAPRSALTSMRVEVPREGNGLDDDNDDDEGSTFVQWTVGGGFRVAETGLLYGKRLPEGYDGTVPLSTDEVDEIFSTMKRIESSVVLDGRTVWHVDGPYPTSDNLDGDDTVEDPHAPPGPVFSSRVPHHFDDDDNQNKDNDNDNDHTISVLAYAILDAHWADPPNRPYGPPDLPPQSHLVNARTDPTWHYESPSTPDSDDDNHHTHIHTHGNDLVKVVQGQTFFFTAVPLVLALRDGSRAVNVPMRLPHPDKPVPSSSSHDPAPSYISLPSTITAPTSTSTLSHAHFHLSTHQKNSWFQAHGFLLLSAAVVAFTSMVWMGLWCYRRNQRSAQFFKLYHTDDSEAAATNGTSASSLQLTQFSVHGDDDDDDDENDDTEGGIMF